MALRFALLAEGGADAPLVGILRRLCFAAGEDNAALRRAAANPRGRAPLDLPKTRHIEGRASPKEILRRVLVQAAKPGRQQQQIRSNDKVFGRLRRQLLEDLDTTGPVTQLSAWQKLVADINRVVAAMASQ